MKKCSLILVMMIMVLGLTGCEKTPPTNEHVVMMTAQRMNYGEVDRSEDHWESDFWTVYYDGAVEFYEQYYISGAINQQSWTLSEADFNEVFRILSTEMDVKDDYSSASDGEAWRIVYYDDDQKELETYNGYIYNHDAFLQLEALLEVPAE